MLMSVNKFIVNSYYHVVRALEQSFDRHKPHFKVSGFIVAQLHLLFYLLNYYFLGFHYESIALRLVAIFLGILIGFYSFWPNFIKRFSLLIWFVGIIYILPFHFTLMLIVSDFDSSWLFGAVLMVFLSFLVLVDFFLVVLVQLIGLSLAVCLFLYVYSASVSLTDHNFYSYLVPYVFALLVGYLYVSLLRTSLGYKDKLDGMMSVTSNIAHELRTPLLSVRSGAAGIRQYLPVLLESYKYAREHRDDIPMIRISHIEQLEEVLQRINKEVDYSNNIIDMMLINASGIGFEDLDIENCSVALCVSEALDRYAYQLEEKTKINLNLEKDFEFMGVRVMIIHVLLNLLKNAFYYIRKAEKGTVHIWIEHGRKFNKLHFKDTGTGISRKVLPHIFEQFYTTSRVGTGIGLTYCRTIVEKLGGEIRCYSKEGEYTEFILYFPKIIEREDDFQNTID